MTTPANDSFKLNNFDLIRLFAALQVALHHAMTHLELNEGWWGRFSPLIPGVPIFFFVSGLLISKSYETNSRLREYSLNRILRIYPALIVCTAIAVISVYLTGYFATHPASWGHLAFWIGGQMTFLQFYPPPFMREFGSGVLNGSLWTVTVELQFYVLIPIMYWMLGKFCRTLAHWNWALVTLILVFVGINVWFHPLNDAHSDLVQVKLLRASFIPWFYMFLIGVLVQKNFDVIHRWISGYALLLVPGYLALAYFGGHSLGLRLGNEMSPLLYLPLVAAVMSCAYSTPWLANKILRRNDISYGVYIYHIPIINLLMYYGYMGETKYVVWVMVGSVIAAALSWVIIERPAMKMKKHPLLALGRKE